MATKIDLDETYDKMSSEFIIRPLECLGFDQL